MKNILIALITSLLVTACAPTTIYSDYDKSIDFKTYTTFAWLPKTHDTANDNGFNNQIIENNVKNLASGELKTRGYKVDVNSPDVLLDFHVSVANKVDHVSTPVYSYPYNYNNYNNNVYNNNSTYNNTGYYNNMYYNNNNNYYNNYNNNINNSPSIVGYKTQDVPYEEGTLTIIMIDRKTNQLIWKGWSVGSITDEQSYEYELPSDIHRVFKEYPVPLPKK